MAGKKVAIVTGSNKGIGYAIVKGLCKEFKGDVFLTSRNTELGLSAVESLNKLGLEPKYHQLDITDINSITNFRDFIKENYGAIDVLVNNAAIAFKQNATEPFSKQAEETLHVNYFCLKNVCSLLFPLLRSHARVVNMSSSAGHLSRIPGNELRKQLSSSDLTEKELDELMSSFVASTKDNTYVSKGWPSSTYVVSKVGVSALTRIQQKKFDENPSVTDICVNSVHPGYVDTDMSSHKGPLTIEQGAQAPLYAALLPLNIAEPKGGYIWRDKKAIDWTDENMNLTF